MAHGKPGGRGSTTLLKSVGACPAFPTEKKKQPCVIVAYLTEARGEVNFLALPIPAKGKRLVAEDIFSAIAAAEKTEGAVYLDDESRPRDVYFCRPEEGNAVEVLERNEDKNCFLDGFAEVASQKLRFRAEFDGNFKFFEKFSARVTSGKDESEKDSLGYAIVNAYNACLLGRVFLREELYLETRDKNRVKIEVRNVSSKYVTEGILYVRPVVREAEGYTDYYLTEEFNYHDGSSVSCRVYQIKYSERFGDYNVSRV